MSEALTKEIKTLRAEIERHNRLYYQQGTSEISDHEYDLLVKKLEQLERRRETKKPLYRRVPELPLADSPTQHVGGVPTKGFNQVQHLRPMMSLDNTYSQDEVRQFIARAQKLLPNEKLEWTVEPKIDGVAMN